jgi:hypothetical protein
MWDARDQEEQINENRQVAHYNQQAFNTQMTEAYQFQATDNLPINPLQTSHFNIPEEQLL